MRIDAGHHALLRKMNTTSMGIFNVKKVYEEQSSIDGGCDNISLLPDCILDHILSYLPTKEAVATSVLSKRWKYLWTSVPILDFDDSLLYSSQYEYRHPLYVTCFMNFIDKVLKQRETSNIERFRLSCRVCFSASRVNEWILSAIRHKLQELDLCLFVDDPFALPGCVFNNQILTVLKLEMNCTLHLPPRIFIPCLKTLHLRLVTFPSDNSMQSLFSSCPFLEELAVLDCEWMNLKSVSITIPSLKILIIDDLPFCSVDDLRGCEININAGNLIFFKYSGYLSNKINIYGHSSSALALINIPTLSGKQREIGCRTVKLFGGLANVSNLRISSGTIESLFHAEDMMENLPKFENLKFSELGGKFRKHSIKLLIKLLQCMPKLEFLHFCEGLGRCEYDSGMMKLLPDCALSSLKKVNYKNFRGTNTEMWFLSFLLKNAIVLEKMNVYWSTVSLEDPMKQKEINKQLHALPKGSKHCALLITT